MLTRVASQSAAKYRQSPVVPTCKRDGRHEDSVPVQYTTNAGAISASGMATQIAIGQRTRPPSQRRSGGVLLGAVSSATSRSISRDSPPGNSECVPAIVASTCHRWCGPDVIAHGADGQRASSWQLLLARSQLVESALYGAE